MSRLAQIFNEGVKIAPSTLSKFASDTTIQGGFEVEWRSEIAHLKHYDPFHGKAFTVDTMTLADAATLDGWDSVIFERMYDDHMADMADLYSDLGQTYELTPEDYFAADRRNIMREMSIDIDYAKLDTINDEGIAELARALESQCDINIIDWDANYNGSIKATHGYHDGYFLETDNDAAELISHVQPLPTMIADLQRILAFVQTDGGTSAKDGLHISLSIPGLTRGDYDPLKMVLFLGEDFVLDTFNRGMNEFTSPHWKTLLSNRSFHDAVLAVGAQDGADVSRNLTKRYMDGDEELRSLFNNLMAKERMKTINFSKLSGKEPHVEFRAIGNGGFENRWEDIKSTILRYAMVMKLGTDASYEREEYQKKLTLFFTKLTNEMRAGTVKPITSKSSLTSFTTSSFAKYVTALRSQGRDIDWFGHQIKHQIVLHAVSGHGGDYDRDTLVKLVCAGLVSIATGINKDTTLHEKSVIKLALAKTLPNMGIRTVDNLIDVLTTVHRASDTQPVFDMNTHRTVDMSFPEVQHYLRTPAAKKFIGLV